MTKGQLVTILIVLLLLIVAPVGAQNDNSSPHWKPSSCGRAQRSITRDTTKGGTVKQFAKQIDEWFGSPVRRMVLAYMPAGAG